MKSTKKKGFTLIEIIAAVTILGILSVIGIVSVNSIIQKGKEEHYTTAEKNFRLTAESFVQANRNYLPKNIGEMKKITLRTLVEENYIEQIKDYYDKKCDLDESYVQIFKYSKTGYSYLTYLNCPDYKNKEILKELKPIINITWTEDKDNVSNTKAIIDIKDDHKILSYSITIYKYEEEVYTTGNIEANYEKNIQKEIEISKYTPGDIKLVVKATNIYGQTTTLTEQKTYKDKKGPQCIISSEDINRTDADWKTGTRKITVGCDDGEEGSGCTREEFTKTFKGSMKTGTITIEDKAGNKTNCTVDVYIDNLAPSTCIVSSTGTKGLDDWYISNATVELTSEDTTSGIKYKSLTTSNAQPLSTSEYNGKQTDTQTETKGITWYGYIEDYAGNKTKCSSDTIKVDTTPPTPPTGGAITISGSNTSASLTAVSNGQDTTSGVKEYRYVVKNNSTPPANSDSEFITSRSFTRSCGTSYYAYAITVDNAGNKSSVYTIGNASDGKNEYVNYGTCSKACDTGTQTSKNSCLLVTDTHTRNCNTRACCTDSTIIYKQTTTCSKTCGGGKYYRNAYSSYDENVSCSNYSGYNGSSCNTQSCCTPSATYGSWSSCSCYAGNCTQSRSVTKVTCPNGQKSTSYDTEYISCDAPAHTHDWNARGSTCHYTGAWSCSCGRTHTCAYYRRCAICGTRKAFSPTYDCADSPHGPTLGGWVIVPD